MTARRNDPLLGLATTEVLFRELISRFSVTFPLDAAGTTAVTSRAIALAEILGGLSSIEREYRPVDQ
jgi:hypothetical protein